MAAVEHLAGQMLDGLQRCVRCRAVLTDYRTAEVRMDAPRYLPGWDLGERVVIEGRSMWVADAKQPAGSGAPLCSVVRTD